MRRIYTMRRNKKKKSLSSSSSSNKTSSSIKTSSSSTTSSSSKKKHKNIKSKKPATLKQVNSLLSNKLPSDIKYNVLEYVALNKIKLMYENKKINIKNRREELIKIIKDRYGKYCDGINKIFRIDNKNKKDKYDFMILFKMFVQVLTKDDFNRKNINYKFIFNIMSVMYIILGIYKRIKETNRPLLHIHNITDLEFKELHKNLLDGLTNLGLITNETHSDIYEDNQLTMIFTI